MRTISFSTFIGESDISIPHFYHSFQRILTPYMNSSCRDCNFNIFQYAATGSNFNQRVHA